MYIGSSSNISHRWKAHRRQLSTGRHHSRYLQFAWNKYGAEAFTFKTIILCSKENLYLYEQLAVSGLGPPYNVCKVIGSTLGIKMSEETRQKMSFSRLGEKNPIFGKTHTEEAREKIRVARAGVVSSFKGRKHTEETIELLRLQRLGKSHPHGEKISAALTGKKRAPFTEEHKARIAAAKRGIKLSQQHKENIGKAGIGRKKSPETIDRLSVSITEYWRRRKNCASL